jgi:hypothetical protein
MTGMKRAISILVGGLCLSLAAPEAWAQYAYPARGQSPATQHKDEAACSKWATGQTGYNPAHPPPVVTTEAAPVSGSGARVRGAAGGAVVGAIAGNAGAGAATGAVLGGMSRRAANRRAAEQQNDASQQYASSARSSYDRARAACLTGRGYTVR